MYLALLDTFLRFTAMLLAISFMMNAILVARGTIQVPRHRRVRTVFWDSLIALGIMAAMAIL